MYFTKAWRDALPSMKGKVVAITGTTSGTGYVTAMECVRLGAHVLMLNRPSARATFALEAAKRAAGASSPDWPEDWRLSVVGRSPVPENDKPGAVSPELPPPAAGTQVQQIDCDLMSLASVRAAAKRVVEIAGPLGGLDALVMNAGITSSKGDTEDGYQKCMQVCLLSHMVLLKELFPSIEAAQASRGDARVVWHSSAGLVYMWPERQITEGAFQKSPRPKLPGLRGDSGPSAGMYARAKAAMFMNSYVLAQKLQNKGSEIRSVCVHPGFALTKIYENNNGNCFIWVANMVGSSKGQSDADGAMPMLHGLLSPDAESGKLYAPDGSKPLGKDTEVQMKGVPELAILDGEKALLAQAGDVWTWSWKGLGVEPPI